MEAVWAWALLIPAAGAVVLLTVLALLGARVRRLRRLGRITYKSRTNSDSNTNFW